MTEYKIKSVSNGWLLTGPKDRSGPTEEKTLFLSTIHAVADILTTWDASGFPEAAVRTDEKYKGG